MKNLILIFTIFLVAGTKLYAQPYLRVTNNTNCKVYFDFNSRDLCGVPFVGTGPRIAPPSTILAPIDATAIYGSSLSATHAWSYGRVGDDSNNCSLVPGGGGCTRNFYLNISDGSCMPGVTTGCFNRDLSAACNSCGTNPVSVTATYHANGDLDLVFN